MLTKNGFAVPPVETLAVATNISTAVLAELAVEENERLKRGGATQPLVYKSGGELARELQKIALRHQFHVR